MWPKVCWICCGLLGLLTLHHCSLGAAVHVGFMLACLLFYACHSAGDGMCTVSCQERKRECQQPRGCVEAWFPAAWLAECSHLGLAISRTHNDTLECSTQRCVMAYMQAGGCAGFVVSEDEAHAAIYCSACCSCLELHSSDVCLICHQGCILWFGTMLAGLREAGSSGFACGLPAVLAAVILMCTPLLCAYVATLMCASAAT
jgi:hypothetical protein